MGAKMYAKRIARIARIAKLMSMLVVSVFIASFAMADTVIEYTYDAAGNPTKVEIKTDPANADTDGDGMPDWFDFIPAFELIPEHGMVELQ